MRDLEGDLCNNSPDWLLGGFSSLSVLVSKFPINSAPGGDVQCFASGHACRDALIIAAWDVDRHRAVWLMPQVEVSNNSDDQRMFRSSSPKCTKNAVSVRGVGGYCQVT